MKVASVIVADAEGIREDLVRRHGPIPNCKVLVYGRICDMHELTALNSEASGMRPGSYYLVLYSHRAPRITSLKSSKDFCKQSTAGG